MQAKQKNMMDKETKASEEILQSIDETDNTETGNGNVTNENTDSDDRPDKEKMKQRSYVKS